MQIVFYDQSGQAIAYSDDEVHIFLFTGEAVAYMDADAVYSYRGVLLGWFERGWLRDKDGRCVAFSENPATGPQRPLRRQKPEIAPKQPVPVREHQDTRALRPIHSNAWSRQSALDLLSRLPRSWPGDLGTK
ncbi:MAG TPA: hypothetical protein VF651_10395 [Gammaproteobacteria bacterium]